MQRDYSRMVRQGDVTLVPVTGAIEGTVREAVNGRVIVLEGEATGHHHSLLADRAEVLDGAEAVYVRIMSETALEHQEHAAVTLVPGTYEVIPDTDYVPGELPRRVLD